MNVIDICERFDVPITGLIHVGANRGHEYPDYHERTHGPLLYVEAIPAMVELVRAQLDPERPHFVRQAVVSDTSGETVTFNVASNSGASSSILEPGRHADLYPQITFAQKLELVTERLDDLVAERPEAAAYNVLLLDVQGAELHVLRGATELLSRVDAVFSEVSSEPLYEGGCTFLEVAGVLAEAGLVFRDADMTDMGWGDALFSRTDGALQRMLRDNLALGRPTRQSSSQDPDAVQQVVDAHLPRDFGVHTAHGDPAPFWEVDLGEVRDLSRLVYLERPRHPRRGAFLRISTSVDGEHHDVVYRRRGRKYRRIVDLPVATRARYVRVSLESGGPLHFRKLVVI